MIFAHLFGLSPRDVDGLSVAEFNAFRSAADDHQRELKKGARRG